MFFLYVNGNLIHDKTGDGSHAPMQWRTMNEATKATDAIYEAAVEAFQAGPFRRFTRLAPRRESYVVASEPPPVPDATADP